jgi:hypothetical protein
MEACISLDIWRESYCRSYRAVCCLMNGDLNRILIFVQFGAFDGETKSLGGWRGWWFAFSRRVFGELHVIAVSPYPWRNSPNCARASSFSRFYDHTQTRHTRQDSSGRVISLSQKPLLDYTQQSQETDFHVLGEIRTRSFRKQASLNARLTPRWHWDRPLTF